MVDPSKTSKNIMLHRKLHQFVSEDKQALYTHTHTHTHTNTHTHIHSHTHSHTHSLTHSLTHTHTHTNTHTHTHRDDTLTHYRHTNTLFAFVKNNIQFT